MKQHFRETLDIKKILSASTNRNFEKAEIQISTNSYPVKTDDIWKNWFMFAFFAFRKLDPANIGSFVTIGTANGIDAICTMLIFERLKKMIVTDLDPDTVKIAKSNITRFAGSKIELKAFAGNLSEPLIARGIKVDLIYENLPNIPGINVGDKTGSAYDSSKLNEAKLKKYAEYPRAKKYLLLLHLAALAGCKDCLNPGGSLILSIGGRVPLSLLEKLITHAGYQFSELISGFKLQTECEEVLPAYARAEKGLQFDFYLYGKAVELLHRNGIFYPYIHDSGEELKTILESAKISATEALRLQEKGLEIGHTVHILRAML